MEPVLSNTEAIRERLHMLLRQGGMSDADADRAGRLSNALQSRARVAILAPYAEDGLWLLQCMLLHEVLPPLSPVIPTVELTYAPEPKWRATMEDGQTLSRAGWPSLDLMEAGPVYIALDAPIEELQKMSVLLVPLGTDSHEQHAALAWAAKRSEVSVWCAPYFTGADAQLWMNAPDRLTYHAFCVLTGGGPGDALPREVGFDGVYRTDPDDPVECQWQVTRLMTQLMADIAEAQREDIDAAELFLHRVAHHLPDTSKMPQPDTAPNAESEGEKVSSDAVFFAELAKSPEQSPEDLAEFVAAISEPMLFLRRRARALIETLEWDAGEDWAHLVLSHCVETTEGLRDRAVTWPDQTAHARRLMSRVEEACDTAVLLQIEAGPDQARDATRLLTQIRDEFEEALAA